MLDTLKTSLIAISIGFASLFGYHAQPTQLIVENPIREVVREVLSGPVQNEFSLKASTDSSEVRALFTTTLASKITSSATTMTLTSATDKEGNTLASSTYGFIIDEGTSVEEFVLADCTATACTNMTRGLSVSTATTSIASLQFEHRRGASVKITDAPSLVFATNVIRGKQNLDRVIQYGSGIATTTIAANRGDLASWGLVQDTAFSGSGAIKATTGAVGYVLLATQLQQASSTSTSGGNPLVMQSGNATSSCNTTTSALNALVADNTGKLNGNCAPTTFTATTTFSAGVTLATTTATTTNIGAFPAYWIGKNIKLFTATGANTFLTPTGINKVWVRICGGGGGGGNSSGASNTGGAGGGGGCSEGMVNLTGTTSVQIFIGSGGTAGNPGTASTFSTFINAGGGGAGAGAVGAGGTAGTASGGDVNISGQVGFPGLSLSAAAGSGIPGGLCAFGAGSYCEGGLAGINSGAGGTALNGFAEVVW